ncbi:MAG TPA: universal stress protein [Nitrospira sp.]|nr:universal stress protein [Nitrospira sp.]
MKIERILLATDFSAHARRAEDYGAFMAAAWDAALTVMSVLEFPPGMNPDYPINQEYLRYRMNETSEQLADCTQRLSRRGLRVASRITTGLPSEEIVGAARADDSDLIVLGTRGKSGLAHVLLGSTAERVIRTAPCPVLAVHIDADSPPERVTGVALERLLVPIDFSDYSLDAVEYAALVAARAKASVKLLHVLEPLSYGLDFTLIHADERQRKRERCAMRLDALSTALSKAGLSASSLIRGGVPADSILDEARAGRHDLIVMGTHGRRGMSHVLCGSVAEAVLRKAACPVLAVRSPKFAPGHRRLAPRPVEGSTHERGGD